jgi:hypothetical protein
LLWHLRKYLPITIIILFFQVSNIITLPSLLFLLLFKSSSVIVYGRNWCFDWNFNLINVCSWILWRGRCNICMTRLESVTLMLSRKQILFLVDIVILMFWKPSLSKHNFWQVYYHVIYTIL